MEIFHFVVCSQLQTFVGLVLVVGPLPCWCMSSLRIPVVRCLSDTDGTQWMVYNNGVVICHKIYQNAGEQMELWEASDWIPPKFADTLRAMLVPPHIVARVCRHDRLRMGLSS